MDIGGLVGRYWCHMCSQEVNPLTEVVEIKCPQCNSGFIEHVEEEDQGGGPTGAATAAAANDPTGLNSERALSLWAPILLGMLASHRDDGFLSLLHRRQQRSSAVLQLLQESNSNESAGGSEREGQHMILVNPFSQAVIVRAPFNGGGGDNNSNSNNSRIGGVSVGDYFVGPGLEQLLQHLAENDPNRYGTPPAKKDAVEAMPTVEVGGEKSNCPVCLEEFEIGEEAREMPCRHRFHGGCIVPWLEMHSSCPLCRFQMPVDDGGDKDSASSGGGEVNGAGGENNARRFWLPVPFAFSGLFSFSLNSPQQSNGSNSSFVLESSSSQHTNTNGNGIDSPSSALAAPTSSSSATDSVESNSNSHSQEEEN